MAVVASCNSMTDHKTTFRGIDHIGITVPDLDAATRFLSKAFDATVIYDTHLRTDPPQTGPKAEEMLALTRGSSVVAIRLLRLANGASIELFEANKPDPTTPIGVADIGIHHFAVYCDDLQAALQRVISAGATPLAGPNALNGPEEGSGNRMNYVRAPWGTLIELISYPSGVSHPNGTHRWTPEQEN